MRTYREDKIDEGEGADACGCAAETCGDCATIFDVEGGEREEPKALGGCQSESVGQGKDIRDMWTERIKTMYEMRRGTG